LPEPYGDGKERIEIKKIANRILVNSIYYPTYIWGSFTLKRNKENVRCFLNNCIQILKGNDVEEVIKKRQFDEIAEFWREPEWTFIKILKRIIGYGLALLFLVIGLFIISEGAFLEFIYFGIPLILSWTYIRNDLKILWTKSKMRSK
jgi:hypothetical protein